MVDLHSILLDHKAKKKKSDEISHEQEGPSVTPTLSEIPDMFFDQILVEFKLGRIEILVLMYIYRMVYCRPNLYKVFGISPLLSHYEMAKTLVLEVPETIGAIHKLEELGFLSTIRAGQYFVRRCFTKENDEIFKQTYADFDI